MTPRHTLSFVLIATSLTVHSSAAVALSIVTSDPGQVGLFQTGATVEHFDDLSALTITSYASGQTVPAGSQFSSRNLVTFTAPFFNSGGATFTNPVSNPGTPIGIFDPDGAIAGDVESANNVAGPLGVGSDQAFNFGFMEVIFPTPVSTVGLWVTHGTFKLILKDSNNSNLATGDFEVTGSAGQFIGIQRDTADIGGVTMGFPEAFTIDDFTYAATPVPAPGSLALLATGVISALAFRRRRRGAV